MADEAIKTPAEEAAEHIIPDSALVGKGVSAQPNPMELPEDQAKAVFDQITKEIIIPAYNAFVQFVAEQLGLIDTTKDMDKPISTATQAALDDKHDKELRTGSTEESPVYRVLSDNNLTDELKGQLESAYQKEHTHARYSLLESLTQQDIDNWNGGNVLTKDNQTAYEPTLPYHPATLKYVADTVKKVGAADMASADYDPQKRKTDIFQYVDDKVSNIPTPDVSGQIKTHNEAEDAHGGTFAKKNHTHTASEVGAAAENHTHTASEVGAAAENHTHAASELGITYGTEDLQAGVSPLPTGTVYLQYE